MSDLRTSIALCTYNGGPYLAEQLKSYTRQSKLPDELVVCDDRSGDTTVEILRSFAEVAPFPIKWHINDCNLGTVKNFERAIHLCSGDIIFLSDQDDVWRDDKISSVMDVFGKHPEVGAVFSDAEVVDQALCSLGYRMWHTVGFTLSRQRQMNVKGGSFSVLLKYNVVTGATMAFRSEFTPRFSPLPEGWVHDGWIALMIAAISDIGLVPEPLILYRQHATNQIGGVRTNVIERASRAKSEARQLAATKLQNWITQYRSARDRLRNEVDKSRWVEIEPLLNAKIAHLESRLRMRQMPKRRFDLAFKELITLRYERYSAGTVSFVKDLLFGERT